MKKFVSLFSAVALIISVCGTTVPLNVLAEQNDTYYEENSARIGDETDFILENQPQDEIALASTGTYYPEYGLYFNEATGEITGSDGTITGKLAIPEYINSIEVVKIGVNAFSDCTNITEVQFPSTLKEISYYAFKNCTGLTSITIPKNCNNIGNSSSGYSAFPGCDNLKIVTFEEGITTISGYAFKNCTSIVEIKFPSSLTRIDAHAFRGCTGLTSVTIPKNCSNIGDSSGSAFSNCNNLKNVTFEDGITKISDYAFIRCDSIENIIFPKSLTTIGTCAFYSCDGLRSVTIPENCTITGGSSGSAFEECSNLETVIFSEGLTTISNYAFIRCDSIKTVVFPETLERIGSCAFYSCDGITDIHFPQSLTSISSLAFGECDGLTSVVIPAKCSVGSTSGSVFQGCSNLTTVIFQEGKIGISNYSFMNNSILKKVVIPSSVKNIGNYAFYNTDNIVIYCYAGSYAVKYAEENDIPYVLISNSNTSTGSGDSSSDNQDDTITYGTGMKNNSLGFNKNTIKVFDTNGDVLRGPKITILNKSFHLFELPIDMSIKTPIYNIKYNAEKEKFEVMLGKMDKTALAGQDGENKTYYEIKEFVNSISKGQQTYSWNKYQHLKSVLKSEKMSFGFTFNATPAGYMEFDKEGNLLEGAYVYVLNMDYNVKQPIPAVPIVYVKVGIGVDATGKFGIKYIESNAYSLFGSLGLDISPYVGLGVGDSKFVGVEGGAKLKLATKLELVRNKRLDEIFSADMTGSLYFKIKALSFINFDKKWDISKTAIYPNFGAELMSIELENYDDMVVIPRDYMNEESVFMANNNISLMSLDSIDTSTFKTNVYPYSEPQLIKMNDGREILLWLDNDTSRNDINCTVLKYSINNGGIWTKPADIYNDGKADFAPSIAKTENGIAIAWQKANTSLENDSSLSEMAQQIDLYYSEFDGNIWSIPSKLTDNNSVYEFAPGIAVNGSNTIVTWMENSENDCFALTGTNNIYSKTNADNWEGITTISSDLNSVTNLGVTYINDIPTIAYTVDTDGNIETSDDVELFEYYDGEIFCITGDNVVDYALTMTENGYSWIHNNQLWERTANGVSLMDIPVMPLYLNNTQILSNGTDRAIVWKQTNDYASDLYAMYYDNEDKSWGEPVKLTDDNKKIRESSGYMTDDGTIRMTFSQSDIDETSEDVYGKSNIMISNITDSTDIEAISADCEYDEYVSGEAVSIWTTIKNNSADKVSKFNVTVECNNEIIAQNQVETVLKSGETATIETPYTLPNDLSNKTISVTVIPIGATDSDLSNNTTNFEMGFADVVTTATTNNSLITAEVENTGYLSAENVVCTLKKADGTVVEEKSIGTLPVGAKQQVQFTTSVSENVVVSTTTDSYENFYANNDAAITFSANEVKGVWVAYSEYAEDGEANVLKASIINENNAPKDVKVILTSHLDGILCEIQIMDIKLLANSSEDVSYKFTKEADEYKVFIWNNGDKMSPYNNHVVLDVIE